jgi:hypothetical protein
MNYLPITVVPACRKLNLQSSLLVKVSQLLKDRAFYLQCIRRTEQSVLEALTYKLIDGRDSKDRVVAGCTEAKHLDLDGHDGTRSNVMALDFLRFGRTLVWMACIWFVDSCDYKLSLRILTGAVRQSYCQTLNGRAMLISKTVMHLIEPAQLLFNSVDSFPFVPALAAPMNDNSLPLPLKPVSLPCKEAVNMSSSCLERVSS